MEHIQDKSQLLNVSKITPGEDDEEYRASNKTRSAHHNMSVLKKVKDKVKKLKASITNFNKHDCDNQTQTEEAQYDHYSKAEDDCLDDKKVENTPNLPGKELPEKRPDQVLQPEIVWSSPGAFTRAKSFGSRSSFRIEVHRVRSHGETAKPASGEEPVAIAPLTASVQAINNHDVFRKVDQSLDATPYKEKKVHFLDADIDSRIQKLSLASDNINQSVKVDEKGQDGTNDGEETGITENIFDTASRVKNIIFSKLDMNQYKKLLGN